MSIISKFLTVVTEPQFKLARDLTAMAIADGEVTPEEKEAMTAICHLEGIDETKLMEALRGGYDNIDEEMPKTRKDRETYLRDIIRLIGADGYTAPQEIYLFQIIASRMELNQMNVIGLFLMTTTHQFFQGDIGSKVLKSFLENFIDPKKKGDEIWRQHLHTIYETVAMNTENDDRLLAQNLSKTTQALLMNKILVDEFSHVGLDFQCILEEEEKKVFKQYTR
jgi:hypothetical protein